MSALNKVALAAVLAAALAGCSANPVLDPNGYLDRRDQISLTAGDAVANNIAIQMVDPWPAHAGQRNIGFDGQKMQTAVERYRNNKVIPPRGIAASGVYTPPPPDNSGPSAANMTPVGPMITQGPAVK
jgi:type IV pilus biogenesis protein CpaD/CtpE